MLEDGAKFFRIPILFMGREQMHAKYSKQFCIITIGVELSKSMLFSI